MEVIIIVFVLFFLMALFSPRSGPKEKARIIMCVNNLHQIGTAFRLWAEDNRGNFPMQVSVTNGGTMELIPSGWAVPHFQVMSNYFPTKTVFHCPVDTARKIATNTTKLDNAQLSYFVNIDARPAATNVFLAGDRNLATNGVKLEGGRIHLIGTNSSLGWTAEFHVGRGNVGMVDGSARRTSTNDLRSFVAEKCRTPNRFAIP